MKISNNVKASDSDEKLSKGHIIWSYSLGLILILFLIWYYNDNKKTEYLLNKEGLRTKGIIVELDFRTRGNSIYYIYKFETNKNTIITSSFRTTENINVGDSIQVLYYPKDPNKNKPILEN